ncbi:MAG: hypothetical protein EXR69_16395 [Myxococcales bacterium]|nr:hypothetical protein [Myxococcales bacterium]
MKRRTWLLLALVAVPGVVTAAAPTCWNFLTRTTYSAGFNATDLCTTAPCGASPTATFGVTVQLSQLQLTPVAHDINNIKLPFDQDVYAFYVGNNASSGTYGKGSHTVSWFYYDTAATQMGGFLQGGVGPALIDSDGDMIMDFFQSKTPRPRDGLYSRFDNLPLPGAADLANAFTPRGGGAPAPFSDGGTWPRIPNILEQFVTNGGGILWENTDDDGDATTYTSLKNGALLMPLVSDPGGVANGLPDYDVNGDGINDNDGAVALGQLRGTREFVFNLNSYVDYAAQAQTLGQPGGQNQSSPSMGACTGWNFPGCTTNGQMIWNYPGCTMNGQCVASTAASATTTIQWTGGWCTLCGGSYACTNGYSGVAQPKTFFDPVPAGGPVTQVCTTLWYAGCGGGTGTWYLNGANKGTWGSNTACSCGTCPSSVTLCTNGAGYNRTANNSIFFNATGYSTCLARATVTVTASSCSQTCAGSTCSCLSYNTAPGSGWWHETYWDSQATKMAPWFGQPAANWPAGYGDTSYDSPIGTYFSKQMLNSDRSLNSGIWRNTGTQLDGVKLTTDWALVAGNSNGGFLTAQQRIRLSGVGGLTLAFETRFPPVQSQAYAPGGTNYYPPHALLGANSAGANRNAWLMGFEDVPLAMAWCNTPFYRCKTPGDFNNLVFWMLSEEGGSAISEDISGNCANAKYAASCITSAATISKVSFSNFAPTYTGCTQLGPLLSRTDLYYSIDNGATWHLVLFPVGQTAAVIDTITQGYSGYQLRWKVNMVTAQTDSNCVIKVPNFNVGYEAITAGNGASAPTYQYAEQLPVANVLARAQYETISIGGGDLSARGHLTLHRVYDPDSAAPLLNKADSPLLLLWDAGQRLAAKSPNTRSIYFFDATNGNLATLFNTAIGAANGAPAAYLWSRLNPFTAAHTKDAASVNRGCPKVDGKCIYDFAGAANAPYFDNSVDAKDGVAVAQWTQGYSDFGSPAPAVARQWTLGGIFHSSPAVIGPPYATPWWLRGSQTPLLESTTFSKVFMKNNANRATITLVGASDGLLHAFDTGSFRWGNDLTTLSTTEAHGYFEQKAGVRNAGANQSYGSGDEVWALAAPSQLPLLRNNMLSLSAYKPSVNPRATLDGGLSVADIFYGGAFHTVAFAGDGEIWPHQKPNPAVVPPSPYPAFPTQPSSPSAWQRRARYITAVDVTSTVAPAAVWGSDWTDTDFWGAIWPPAVSPTTTPAGRKWVIATTSGVATTSSNQYVYLIDATTGTTLHKIALGVGLGMYGSPALIDFTSSPSKGVNDRGVADRVYIADTTGRVWKINTGNLTSCVIGTMPNAKGVFAPIAVEEDPKVAVYIYAGSGSDPTTLTDPAGQQFHFRGFKDSDAINQCNLASVLFTSVLPAGQKVWAGPVVTSPNVCVTTSGSWSSDPAGEAPDLAAGGHLCSKVGGGRLLCYQGTTGAVAISVVIDGNSAGSLRAFDGHLFLNTLTGGSASFGAAAWNTTPPLAPGAKTASAALPTTSWSEP